MASDKLLKCNDSNLRDIKGELEGNLELQMIVLGTIQDYKKAANDAGRTRQLVVKRKERGERTAAAQKAKKSRCVDGASEGAAPTQMCCVDTPGQIAGGENDLPKGCKSYSGWKVGFFVELFQYCEPSLFSDAMKAIDSKNLARQLFEFGFGLKAAAIDGETPDKPGTLRKFNCFAALREVYIANGRPFRRLGFGPGGVDWSKPGQGVYQLVIETLHADLGSERGRPNTKFLVRNTIASKTIEMPSGYLGDISGEEYTALRIGRNFSASGAWLLSNNSPGAGDECAGMCLSDFSQGTSEHCAGAFRTRCRRVAKSPIPVRTKLLRARNNRFRRLPRPHSRLCARALGRAPGAPVVVMPMSVVRARTPHAPWANVRSGVPQCPNRCVSKTHLRRQSPPMPQRRLKLQRSAQTGPPGPWSLRWRRRRCSAAPHGASWKISDGLGSPGR
jgi:hypothetical protein